MKASRYFTEKELSCPHCGLNNITDELIDKLTEARDIYGKAIVINSGTRCQEHNATLGSKPTSSHTNGTAVDIRVTASSDRSKLLVVLLALGFSRIGIASSFLHVDLDENKAKNVIWVY